MAGVSMQLLPRTFTPAQRRQIMAWEIASRWRTRTAGKIFPATVSYQLPGSALESLSPLSLHASRVGIGRQASCTAGADSPAARILDADGCAAMLRATYIDETDSLVATVGVAVMPNARAASRAAAGLAPAGPSRAVRALAFRHTMAARFHDRQGQAAALLSAGSYLIMSVVGYADGRPRVPVTSDPYTHTEMSSLAAGIAHAVGRPLGAAPPVPKCPGAPGC
jgi:hypothetical protein